MGIRLINIRAAVVLIGAALALHFTPLAASTVDLDLAQKYLKEAKDICQQDAGRLWGRSLCVPILFVDPQTREFVANESDSGRTLEEKSGLYLGRLPESVSLANTATDWGGRIWTIVMWPLPADKYARAILMVHESFHNIESSMPFDQQQQPNSHLDTRDGRLWLQMEWHALRESLLKTGVERVNAIRDALMFRQFRRQLFPSATDEECRMEMHEGLAEYTGYALCGLKADQLCQLIASRLEGAKTSESLVSSFAYWSGAAYGTLLDASGRNWRTGLTATTDFGVLLQQAYQLKTPNATTAQVEARMAAYDGESIRDFESDRESFRNKRLEQYRALFINGPVLKIPLQQMQISYDPNNLCPLDTLGIVYPTLRLTDLWGTLEVENGALVARNWTQVTLAAPPDTSARPVTGNGWSLRLNPGWKFVPEKRSGDLILVKNGR
jgi:hypothetical protein